MSQRKQRVEHGLRDVLSELITREVKDPRVRAATLITVTKVELNVDLSVAMVYLSIIGDDATIDGALAGLSKAAGFLRGPVGRKLNLQHAPELRFRVDASIDMSEKLAAILRDDEERARAAGREIGGAPAAAAAPAAAVRGDGDDGDGDDADAGDAAADAGDADGDDADGAGLDARDAASDGGAAAAGADIAGATGGNRRRTGAP